MSTVSSTGSAADIAALTATTQAATIGAEIITKTLDTLNQQGGSCGGTSSDMAASYDFQKSVLSAAYGAKGAVTDITG